MCPRTFRPAQCMLSIYKKKKMGKNRTNQLIDWNIFVSLAQVRLTSVYGSKHQADYIYHCFHQETQKSVPY